jgi:hypothetical protein
MITQNELLAILRSPAGRLKARHLLSENGVSLPLIREVDKLKRMIEDANNIISNSEPNGQNRQSNVAVLNYQTAVQAFKESYKLLKKNEDESQSANP